MTDAYQKLKKQRWRTKKKNRLAPFARFPLTEEERRLYIDYRLKRSTLPCPALRGWYYNGQFLRVSDEQLERILHIFNVVFYQEMATGLHPRQCFLIALVFTLKSALWAELQDDQMQEALTDIREWEETLEKFEHRELEIRRRILLWKIAPNHDVAECVRVFM